MAMSNRLTTWELKAVDNLPEVIKRMEQIASLLQQQQQLSASSSSAITKQLSDITSGYNSLVKSMDAVLKEQQANTQAAKDAATASQAAVSASVRASNELRAAKEAERKQLQEIKAQYDAMKSSVTTLGTLIGITFSASQIRQFLVDVIDANTRINLFSKSLEIMLQNKKQADEIAAYALNLSTRSTLDVKQIIEVTQRLVAMGAESGKVNTYLEMLGELSSVVGTHKLPLIAKALLDVQNKQKLYAQEVRQFTDNGIPLFQLLAESMDLPIKKVKQLADDHKITFEDVEKALLKATQEGGKYYGMMALQAESLGGSLKNLSDRVFLAMARFGEFVKDGLGAAIKAAGNFIESMTGTNAQMQRTIDIVKSVTSAIVAFTVSSRAAAVVVAAKELVMRAYTIAVGTTHLAMQGLTAAIGANMTITTAAANTARAFWATLASNPLGLVIAAVGVATSAYYAYKAAAVETTVAVGANTEQLMKEKIALTASVKEVQGYSIGTNERTKAVERLLAKYPTLISYVDADKVSNTQLNNALEQQIKLLDLKIKYSAAAAQAEAVYDRQKDIYKQQFEIIVKLRDSYKDLSEAYPDNGKFLAALKEQEKAQIKVISSSVASAAATQGTLKPLGDATNMLYEYNSLSKQSAAMQGQIAAATMEVSKASGQSTNAQIKDIERQLDALEKAHKQKKVSDDDYKQSRQKLLDEIKRLNGEEIKSETEKAKVIDDGKKKAVLTAKEIAVLTKEIQQDSFKDQMNLIDAQMKLDIERANHVKKSKSEVEKDIVRIVEAAEAEKAALRKKYSDMMLASTKETDSEAAISSKELAEVLKFDMKEVEKEKKKTEAEKRKENKQTHQEWEEYQRDVQRLTKETAKIEEDARRDGIKMAMDYLSAQGGVFGELGRVARKAFGDIDLINGKTVDSYAKTLKAAQENAESTARIFGAGSEQYNQSRVQVAEANKNLTEAQAAMGKAKAGFIMMIPEVIEGLKNMYFQGIVETNKAIVDSMLRTRDIVKQYYNDILRANQENLKAELEAFRGTHEEKITLIREFYEEQKRLSENRDAIDNQITFNARMLEINTETTSKISSAWDLSKGPLGPQSLLKVLAAWKDHNAQMEAAELQREARAQQLRQQRIQEEVDAARQIRDANIQAIQEQQAAYEAAKQKEIDLLNQASEDRNLRLQADDVFRAELLAAGEAREIVALEAAKQREIKRAQERGASAEEVARIVEAFDKLIAEKHIEYQDAMGNKDKEVKLAQQELEAQTADKVNGIKADIANKDKQAKDAMTFENQKYRDFVIQANKDMLESQKAMYIAQLQAEIAMLKGKKNIFNSGRINAAIGDLEQAIRDIEGAGAGAQGLGDFFTEKIKNIVIGERKAAKTPFNAENLEVVTEAYDRDGNVIQLAYTDEDRTFVAYDKNKNAFKVRNATGFVEKTGEKFYKGTPYVEGLSYPDGIDTVPAMINKGERILPDWMNERIGGKQLSNEALEQKVLFADSILNRVASIRQTLTFDKFFNPFPMMPISSTPQADLDALADKIAAAVNANSTSINVTPFGMSVKEKSRMSQNITYYENTVYSKRQ